MRQLFGARVVANEVNSIKPELEWTEVHGQFAQMGGFGRKDNKQVLYPRTLIALLENGQFDMEELQITQKELQDKSKGDILSKGIVALQTTWFVFECLARLQQKLPVTELEVVTLAFATLNTLTYALWWYKPLDVLCPIYLHIKSVSPSEEETPSPSELPEARTAAETEVNSLVDGNPEVKPGRVESGTAAIRRFIDYMKEDARKRPWWKTTWKWLIEEPFLFVATPLIQLLVEDEERDAAHVPTFYATNIPEDDEGITSVLCCFIGMIFGAIHCIAWNSTLLTHVQLLLWRGSSLVLVLQSFLLLAIASASNPHTFTGKIGLFIVSLGTIAYILSRFCVLVLAFLALNHLPAEAFRAISWTSYIPHL